MVQATLFTLPLGMQNICIFHQKNEGSDVNNWAVVLRNLLMPRHVRIFSSKNIQKLNIQLQSAWGGVIVYLLYRVLKRKVLFRVHATYSFLLDSVPP